MPQQLRCLTCLILTLVLLAGATGQAAQKNDRLLVKQTELRGTHMLSPKSVLFKPDGSAFYVNALEGYKTLVFDAASLELQHIIRHSFGKDDASLFLNGEDSALGYTYDPGADRTCRNCFRGKPVEGVFTHGGRFLWISYYRRSYDRWAQSPSALAIIDTGSNAIVRVMPTGPLPKALAVSPDGRTLAVIHWGDNTVGIVDIASTEPSQFSYVAHLVAGKKLDVSRLAGKRRDAACGLCLRGAAFNKDGTKLFVARMSGSGLEVFTLDGSEAPRAVCRNISVPRHLVLSRTAKRSTLPRSMGYTHCLLRNSRMPAKRPQADTCAWAGESGPLSCLQTGSGSMPWPTLQARCTALT
ncbi:MAG: hypothetical protein IJU37_09225 [Desulfovibrio sp.]|nr:hypothetical protein [Desulfovibrio sp.]